MKDISDKARAKDLETIIVISIVLIVFRFIFKVEALLLIALGLLLISVLSKGISRKAAGIWLGFSHYLGAVNTKIILSLIFYLFLTPIAFIYRLLGKNQVAIAKDDSLDSYYTKCNKTFNRDDFEKMW